MAQAKRPAKKPSSGSKSKGSPARTARSTKAGSRKAAPKAPAARVKPTKPTKPTKAGSKAAASKGKAPARSPARIPVTTSKTARTGASHGKAAAAHTPALAQAPAPQPGQRKAPPPSRAALKRALEPSDSNTYIHGFRPYQPKSGESYMSPAQLEHFRQILQAWKRELMEEVDRTVHHMQDEASNFPDPNDRATQESEFGLELRTRDRERKLLKKIDAALERIEDGSYGYCEETGEEIGLRRLEARPVATLSVEAQERRELAERQYGERDDRYR